MSQFGAKARSNRSKHRFRTFFAMCWQILRYGHAAFEGD